LHLKLRCPPAFTTTWCNRPPLKMLLSNTTLALLLVTPFLLSSSVHGHRDEDSSGNVVDNMIEACSGLQELSTTLAAAASELQAWGEAHPEAHMRWAGLVVLVPSELDTKLRGFKRLRAKPEQELITRFESQVLDATASCKRFSAENPDFREAAQNLLLQVSEFWVVLKKIDQVQKKIADAMQKTGDDYKSFQKSWSVSVRSVTEMAQKRALGATSLEKLRVLEQEEFQLKTELRTLKQKAEVAEKKRRQAEQECSATLFHNWVKLFPNIEPLSASEWDSRAMDKHINDHYYAGSMKRLME